MTLGDMRFLGWRLAPKRCAKEWPWGTREEAVGGAGVGWQEGWDSRWGPGHL